MDRRTWWPAAVGAIVYLLLDAQSAWAWGPGVHVGIASEVLSHLAWLPAGIAALLTRFGQDYLYGNIAADVVFAKRLSRIKQFCHHWATGFACLERAADDRDKAFALGYLSHLASDTVAHGKYVPRQIAMSGGRVNFGHLYWELRADAMTDSATRGQLHQRLHADHESHHATLAGLLTDTFLPYPANRHLFTRMNLLVSGESWQRAMGEVTRLSKHPLPPELLSAYRQECVDRTMCLLTSLERSPVLFEDPNGTAALEYAKVCRRDRLRLDRFSHTPRQRALEAAHSHAPSRWSGTTLLPQPEGTPALGAATSHSE